MPNIYKGDKNKRYVLGNIGINTLAYLCLNPSIADDINDDPTIKKLKHFTKSFGYDGQIAINIYPQRTPKPKKLDKKLNKDYHDENLEKISKVLKEHNIKDICAARGDNVTKLKLTYLKNHCIKDIYYKTKNLDLVWYNLNDLTILGNPRHPLYQPKNSVLNQFNIESYIQSF